MIFTFIHTPKKYLLLPLLGLLFVSCLNSSEQGEASDQLVLTLKFSNINGNIIAQSDTINIAALKFLVGTTTLQSSGNDTLLVNGNAFQITHQFTNNETKILASGTFNSDVFFNNLAFEIKQAEQSDTGSGSNIDANAFIEGESENERYSLIIDGSYNGDTFEFKSTRTFNFEFIIEGGSGSNQGSLLYSLPMETNVRDWFYDAESDSLLDPRASSNASAINDNIQSSVILN